MKHQKRITKSLKRKLLLPIFGLSFILVSLTIIISHAKFQELLIEKLGLRANLIENTINCISEGASVTDELQRIVVSLGKEREVKMILVVMDAEPTKIIAANKSALLDESLDYLHDVEISTHIQEVLKTQVKYQHFDKQTSRYEIVLPLMMSQSKTRNEESFKNTVIFVQLDSKPIENHALKIVIQFTLSIFGVLAIVVAHSYYLLRHHVLMPVTKITEEVNVANKVDLLAPSAAAQEYDEINVLHETLHEALWSANKAQQILELQKIELQNSRDQFATLVTNIPGMTFRCAFDANWTMLFMSGLVEELTGYPQSDFIQNAVRTYASIIHPDDSDYVDTEIANTIKENRPYTIEYRLIHRSGKIIWVHECGRGVQNQSGELCFIDGFILDMSEKKQMELTLAESEFRWKFAVEGSGDGLWDWNVQTNKTWFSKQLKSMLGFAEDEIENVFEEWAKRIHPDDISQVMSDVQDYLEDKIENYANEHRLLCKDGSYKWILDRGIIVSRSDDDGKPLRLIGTHTDITDRKNSEIVILEAKAAAESLAKSKSEFLANMSHEIRTPMTAIIGLSQLALNKQMPNDVRDSLTKIYESSNNLLGILNAILDFSKLDAGKLTLENSAFNLITMFRNLHNLFSVSAKNKNLEFSIFAEHDVPKELIGDALRIQQILSNLLGNAIKFTVHGKIELRIKQIENRVDETVLRFSVEDTGIGIKTEYQGMLFKPFQQADNSITRRFGGTGLGLAISRDLLRLMGSDFHIESIEGKGTTIYFDLLLKIPNIAKQITKKREFLPSNQQGGLHEKLVELSKSLVGIKILLAEDNLLNQEIVSGFLKLSGIDVDIAENGIVALELLKSNVYDVILMDIHMPEMDGLQATKAIREQPKYADLPIIALTADITKEEQEKCLSAGMNNLVEKPINPEILLQTLSHCLTSAFHRNA